MMNKFILLFLFALPVHAIYLGPSEGSYISGFCGSYASIVKNYSTYEMFSNQIPDPRAACPGAGCPGITRYASIDRMNQHFTGVVAPNSIINDIFENGVLAPNRMFSRPHVIKHDGIYYATATVMNNYFPQDGYGLHAFLSSPDGINWTYHGKFKGEPAEYAKTHKVFASGMGFIASETPPYFRLYTDGYGVKVAEIDSNDGITWWFVRDAAGNIAELAPPEWTQKPVFHAVQEFNGIYYMMVGDNWPVQQWLFAKSTDGINWISDGYVNTSHKSVGMFVDGTVLKAIPDVATAGSCNYKSINSVQFGTPTKKKRRGRK